MTIVWRNWLVPLLSLPSVGWCIGVGVVLWFMPTKYGAFSDLSPHGPLPLILVVAVAGIAALGACTRNGLMLGLAALLFLPVAVVNVLPVGIPYAFAYSVPAGLLLAAVSLPTPKRALTADGRPIGAQQQVRR